MEGQKFIDPEKLKNLLLNSNEPLIIKGLANWGLLTWSLEKWQHLLKKEKLTFRCGKRAYTKKPQWERTTTTKNATFEDFLSSIKTESQTWMYFDYKYLREWFNSIKELKTNIGWDVFGFPELSSEDSTIWIGSSGAHTPCHIDTYGCNLVVQIYGRKQWILCPPEEDLKPTRIPYEESSVYSSLNFFSPDVEDFKGVKNCRKIVLEPGDALYVPHKWWHYVENLDTAISINVWLPLPLDDDERLKESLVQLFFAQIAKDLTNEMKEIILNPNSDEDIESMTLNASLGLVSKCKSVVKASQGNNPNEFNSAAIETSFEKYPFLQRIPKLSNQEFLDFLETQRNRFSNEDKVTANCDVEELVNVINAFTHPDTISLIKNKLSLE